MSFELCKYFKFYDLVGESPKISDETELLRASMVRMRGRKAAARNNLLIPMVKYPAGGLLMKTTH